MTVKVKRNDAGESIFFARELEKIKPKIYERKYPEKKHAIAIPISPDKDPAAEFITYKMTDKRGVAKFISNYADDLPRADVDGREFQVRVKRVAMAAGYNIDELRASEKVGRPIDQSKINAAADGVMTFIDKIAFLGDSTVGIVGLCGIASVPNTVVATVGGAVTWAAKAALGTEAGFNAILADLNAPFERMVAATKGAEFIDTILMAPTSFAQLQSFRLPATTESVLSYFQKTHPNVEIITCHWLETSGTGSAKQMIAYRRDPDLLALEIPEDLNVLEPQARNLEEIVPVTAKIAGVVCRYPLSLDYSYGM